jgi:acetyl esterase/lipase
MPLLNFKDCKNYLHNYLPHTDLEQQKMGAISPAYNNLQGLAPAIFIVGTQDALVDDTVLMSFRWQRAGNSAVVKFVAGAPHAFMEFDGSKVEVTALGWAAMTAFIRERLAAQD